MLWHQPVVAPWFHVTDRQESSGFRYEYCTGGQAASSRRGRIFEISGITAAGTSERESEDATAMTATATASATRQLAACSAETKRSYHSCCGVTALLLRGAVSVSDAPPWVWVGGNDLASHKESWQC